MRYAKVITGLLGLLLVAADAPRDQLCGLWLNQEGDAKVEIYQEGSSFEAKIVWLKEPNADGKPKVDKTEDPNSYKGGRIYDPKNGKTYDCRVTFEGDKLTLRGFILGMPFLGRTAIWAKSQ